VVLRVEKISKLSNQNKLHKRNAVGQFNFDGGLFNVTFEHGTECPKVSDGGMGLKTRK
jgi:hypothetical protein